MARPESGHPRSRAAKVSRDAVRAKRHSPGLLEPRRRIGDGVWRGSHPSWHRGTGGYLLPTNRPQQPISNPSAFPDALHPTPCQPRILAALSCARLHFPSKCLGPTPWAWWVSWDLASSPPSAAGDGGRQLPALAPCASCPRGFEWSSLTFPGGDGLRSLLLTARALVLPWASAVNCAASLTRRSCGLLHASSEETEGNRFPTPSCR